MAALLIALLPYVLLAAAFFLVWWVGGAVLSITLGQLVLWAVIFGLGYLVGSTK
jgi:hypothetical protein